MNEKYDIQKDEIDTVNRILDPVFNKLLSSGISSDLQNLLSLTQMSWSIIRKNAIFIISYKDDNDVPVNMLLESLRLILEIDADLSFLYNSGEELHNELNKFLYDINDLWKKRDDTSFLGRACSRDFSKDAKLGSTTFDRIQKLSYGKKEERVKDYNLSCCWCHFNALGLVMSENKDDAELVFGKILTKLRWYIVIFLHILNDQDYYSELQQSAKQCICELVKNRPTSKQLREILEADNVQ